MRLDEIDNLQSIRPFEVRVVTIETVFWTQVGSIIAFVVLMFFLYRLLVDQKDATIQLQKENIAFLKDQLSETKSQAPDVLAQRLASRVKLLEEEVKKLEGDKSATQDQVEEKEAELKTARNEAEELTKQIIHARELLGDFLCPHCGAPLAQRAYQSESVEYRGREIDIDHEFTAFECGYEIVDGKIIGTCKNRT